MSKTYDIEIADFNSAGIRAEAKRIGITHMRFIGSGRPDHHPNVCDADATVCVYALPDPQYPGLEILVADTNADPIWRDCDESDWHELMESVGLTDEGERT